MTIVGSAEAVLQPIKKIVINADIFCMAFLTPVDQVCKRPRLMGGSLFGAFLSSAVLLGWQADVIL